MSSTLLYQAFGIRDYRVVRTTRDDKILTFHVEQDPEQDRCSACQSDNVIRHGAVERTIRTVPLGGNHVTSPNANGGPKGYDAGKKTRPANLTGS